MGGASVVAEENDERVLFDAAVKELSEHLADTVIEMRKHGGEEAALDVFDVRELLQVIVRGLHGAVDGVVGEIKKERLRGMPPDEAAGFTRKDIGEVRLFIHGLTAAQQRIVRVVFGFVRAEMRAPYDAAVG